MSLSSELLGVLAPSGLIALGLYLAWAHRDWDRATKSLGLLAATAGALLGGWLGFTATSGLFALVTTTIGAAAGGNLALIAVGLFCDGPRARPWQRFRSTARPRPTAMTWCPTWPEPCTRPWRKKVPSTQAERPAKYRPYRSRPRSAAGGHGEGAGTCNTPTMG